MTTATDPTTDVPVRRSVRVKASPERAFRVFTEEFDGWWPRTHHIGKSPMKRAILEGTAGGRCYTEQEDGTECDWGRVRVWDPPRRLVLAWQITHQWGFEPDIAKASEVEIRFVPDGDGFTRVELEHRNFPKHGEGWESMRKAVDSEGGWGTLLDLYAKRAAAS
jgi:uncharacterized protein YndB with AHSA1/START domain